MYIFVAKKKEKVSLLIYSRTSLPASQTHPIESCSGFTLDDAAGPTTRAESAFQGREYAECSRAYPSQTGMLLCK
jgi:hypothetical protein